MNFPPQPIRGLLRKSRAFVRWGLVAILLAIPWLSSPGLANISIFLKLDGGEIKGEATAPNYKDEIQILTMAFGGGNSGSIVAAGKSTVNDLTLVKLTDRSTPELLRLVMTGEIIDTGRIAFVETINKKDVPVLEIDLKTILVNSHKSAADSGANRPTEHFGLNFAEFSFKSISYSETAQQLGTETVTWNVVTNTGSSSGGNTPPTISPIANQSLNEDGSLAVPFTLTDTETVAGALTLSRSTSNPLVIPLSGLAFGGSGANRTLQITPTANASGSATVSVTVTDAGGLSANRNFLVTVQPVNDAPVIQPVNPQITQQDSSIQVGIQVSDIDTSAANVTVSATSSNPDLIPGSNITFSGSGAATQMTLTPLPGASGSSQITLTANDGFLNSASVPFTLTVNAINNGPSDIQLAGSGGSPPAVAENSAADTLVGTLSATGQAEGVSVSFTLIDSAGGRFKLGGSDQILVNNGSLIDFEASAVQSITVRATDEDLNTFEKLLAIEVINVNEAPVILAPAVLNFAENQTHPVSGISVRDPDSGASDIRVVFSVSGGMLSIDESGELAGKVAGNDSPAVTVIAPVSSIDATLETLGLSYSAIAATAGPQTLTITANDLGQAGMGSAQTVETQVPLTIIASPFNQWRIDKFDEVELLDMQISGALADKDKDGVANLLEYGIGSDPGDSASGPGAVEFVEVEHEGQLYPAARFKRLKPDLDPSLVIAVEVATDDFNWRQDPADTVEVSSIGIDDTHNQVLIRSVLPINGPTRQMLRVRFTLEALP